MQTSSNTNFEATIVESGKAAFNLSSQSASELQMQRFSSARGVWDGHNPGFREDRDGGWGGRTQVAPFQAVLDQHLILS